MKMQMQKQKEADFIKWLKNWIVNHPHQEPIDLFNFEKYHHYYEKTQNKKLHLYVDDVAMILMKLKATAK